MSFLSSLMSFGDNRLKQLRMYSGSLEIISSMNLFIVEVRSKSNLSSVVKTLMSSSVVGSHSPLSASSKPSNSDM